MTPPRPDDCRCGDGRRFHGKKGQPLDAPYSHCIGYEPVGPGPWRAATITQRRRAVLTYVQTRIGARADRLQRALAVSRESLRQILRLLESRRLIQRQGPRQQPHYYPVLLGGRPFDARRDYQRFYATYGRLVRILDRCSPLSVQQLATATGWSAFKVHQELERALAHQAVRRRPSKALKDSSFEPTA